MYKRCYTERATVRQKELAVGLLELMKGVPYEKITVTDLCEYMGIGRKTFYRHFSSKNETLEMLIDLVVLNIETYVPPMLSESGSPYEREMIRFFWYWSDHRWILRILLDNSLIEMFVFRMAELAYSEISVVQKYMAGMDLCRRETILGYYIGGLISMLLFWMKNDFRDSPEELAARVLLMTREEIVSDEREK